MAKLGSLELCGLYDAEISTTRTCSSRQPHQFSNTLGKNPPMSYVFHENLKSLRKGFEVVMIAVETSEKSEFC